MAKSATNQQIEADLGAAVQRGVVVDYKNENPTGNKLVWAVNLSEAAAKAVGDFSTAAMGTPEVKAFIAGLAAGATGGKVRSARKLADNKYRDAIRDKGTVTFTVEDPSDQVAMKKARNMLFSLAYTCGFKSQFKVTTKPGGVLVGAVDPEAFKASKAKAAS